MKENAKNLSLKNITVFFVSLKNSCNFVAGIEPKVVVYGNLEKNRKTY